MDSDSIRREILQKIENLDAWELLPVVALVDRILEGQKKYGPGLKERDWEKDMAEEAVDFWNYHIWSRHDRETSRHQ